MPREELDELQLKLKLKSLSYYSIPIKILIPGVTRLRSFKVPEDKGSRRHYGLSEARLSTSKRQNEGPRRELDGSQSNTVSVSSGRLNINTRVSWSDRDRIGKQPDNWPRLRGDSAGRHAIKMSARTHPAIAVPIDRRAIAMLESTRHLLITSDVLVTLPRYYRVSLFQPAVSPAIDRKLLGT